jgi:hypothetical protein
MSTAPTGTSTPPTFRRHLSHRQLCPGDQRLRTDAADTDCRGEQGDGPRRTGGNGTAACQFRHCQPSVCWPSPLPRATFDSTFMPRTMPRQLKVPSSSRSTRSSGQCPRWGSNPHWADFKSAASAGWATGARVQATGHKLLGGSDISCARLRSRLVGADDCAISLPDWAQRYRRRG